MAMSIAPSGPPKKRGSAGSVYRMAGRRTSGFAGFSRKNKNSKNQQESEEFIYKRRKIDASPFDILTTGEKADVFRDLIDIESELDMQIVEERKRMQQLLTTPAQMLKGVLRVHIYNTSSKQPGREDQPAWNLRLQGRLISPDLRGLYGKPNTLPGYVPKFSSFFKMIQIFLPNNEKLEWQKQQLPRETDGIEIKRVGTGDSEVRIVLHLDNKPPRYKLSDQLAEFLGTNEETQENILYALWEYIKKYKLQDSEEKRFINNDAALNEIFKEERTDIATILLKIKKHLIESEPIEIKHQLKIGGDWTETEHIYDIAVTFEDPLQYEMTSLLKESSSVIFSENAFTNYIPALRSAKGMDIPKNPIEQPIEDLNKQIYSLKDELDKYQKRKDFCCEFLNNPKNCIEKVISDQEFHMQVLQNLEKYDEINQEMVKEEKSAQFYKQYWVKDLVDRYVEINK